MEIEIAAICDAATDHAGKLNMLGVFDRIEAPLPIVIPRSSAIFRIRYQRSEATSHRITLSISSLDGTQLIPPLDNQVEFIPLSSDTDTAAVNMILNMNRLRIEKEGKYLAKLRIDNIEAVILPLYIRDLTPKEPNPLAN